MNKICIKKFLLQFQNKKLLYIPNRGNAGDALIAKASLEIFDELNLKYEFGEYEKKYKNKIILLAGGGNLVGFYKQYENFLNKNHLNNEIIMLPCTIRGNEELIKSFGNNIKIICREVFSYNHVNNLLRFPQNNYLSNDMAFHLKNLEKYKNKKFKFEKLIAFRDHYERPFDSVKYKNPENFDVSNILITKRHWYRSYYYANFIFDKFANVLSNYQTIETDRLHISILGTLLGRKVNLYPNNYYKNKAVYEYSLSKYSNIEFKCYT